MEDTKTINIAVVDSCEFTLIGMEGLVNYDLDKGTNVFFHGFSRIEELFVSNQQYDIIIYDPLSLHQFIVGSDEVLTFVRAKQPNAKIFIYSAAAGFLKFDNIDGVIHKVIPLTELKILLRIIVSKPLMKICDYRLTVMENPVIRLSSKEASVLRGYACNMKTKQIARELGCDVRLVYFYKTNAISKLKAVRGPSFHQRIRWILD